MNSCEVEPLGLVILFADQHLLSGGKFSCAQCAEIDAVCHRLSHLIPPVPIRRAVTAPVYASRLMSQFQ